MEEMTVGCVNLDEIKAYAFGASRSVGKGAHRIEDFHDGKSTVQ
jgi:hypothetical protein